jgi:hypothetical protein
MSVHKSIFISYSWDTEAHKEWVRILAERLAINGVHAHLDQWDVRYGESLTQYMEEKIVESDYILIICTPNYATKSINRQGGVGYEAQIISARIAGSVPRAKFVPILRSGQLLANLPDCAVPPHFQGILSIDMREDAQFDMMFENLIRHIYGQPTLQRPPLGKPPDFIANNTEVSVLEENIHLANFGSEHWELQSGVARNEQHPDTFWIPDEATRRSLEAGDFVKLMFEYIYPDDHDEEMPAGERMWVEIIDLNGPYFLGRLRNRPICTVDWHILDFDSEIVFLPEHVIDVDKGGREAHASEEGESKRKRRKKKSKKSCS